MNHAFSFDARYCSGCKACQAACKDKNNLPTDVLWRRVYEVTGGDWQQKGDTWNHNIFAYNLSMACNHCIHPKCAGVCPTKAYTVREDGIVILDSTKCVGCGYCAWACPYAAPQYDAESGYMSKCNFCFDDLDQGLPPACVAACPLRVLGHEEMDSTARGIPLWDTSPDLHPYPLPGFSHTQPRLAVTPHPGMNRSEAKAVANAEEIRLRRSSNWDELPLMIFTLLTQLAVGGFWVIALLSLPAELRTLPSLLVGASLCVGISASFAHLGTKRNAWRVLNNIRKSSLSKEILSSGLFGLGWLITFISNSFEWGVITCICGIGLVYNMSQVYRFRAAPGWNTWRTNTGFMTSALLLGLSVMGVLIGCESNSSGFQVPGSLWQMRSAVVSILLLIQWAMIRKAFSPRLTSIRIGFVVSGILLSAATIFASQQIASWLNIVTAILVISEEALGRWLFYDSRLGVEQKHIHL